MILINNTFCLLEDTFLLERVQVRQLGSSNFGADFYNVIKTVPVFHCQTVQPADERKGKEALNIRQAHSTQNRFWNTERVDPLPQMNPLMGPFNTWLGVDIKLKLGVKHGAQIFLWVYDPNSLTVNDAGCGVRFIFPKINDKFLGFWDT